MKKSVAIIGYGSIGKKHEIAIERLGLDSMIVSRSHPQVPKKFFKTIIDCFAYKIPDFVVVCTENSHHIMVLQELEKLEYPGKILLEKPLFDRVYSCKPFDGNNIFVGYNLRFNPGLRKLKEIIADESICQVLAYVGQYLPYWRPGSDYRDSYSGKKDKGGGVLRDLSHELDYLVWMFGLPKRVMSMGGRYSNLEIQTDDTCSVLMEMEKCKCVNVNMNYLDKISQRFIVVTTCENTYKFDFIKGGLLINEVEIKFENENTYELEWLNFISEKNSSESALCTYEEGLRILRLIEVIESSQRLNMVEKFE